MYRKFPIYIRQTTLFSWNKKPLRNKSEIFDIYRKYTTKYTLSWNKKRLQNKSEISDLFCSLFCFNLQCSCRKMLQKRFFSKRRRAHAVWKKIFFLVTSCDNYTVS